MENRLEALRKRKKLSQEMVISQLGISKRMYYSYTRGHPIPSDILCQLADFYKCSIDYLLGRQNYTTITVHDDNQEAIAVISKDTVICKNNFGVIFSDD